jgi:hypothetical protein
MWMKTTLFIWVSAPCRLHEDWDSNVSSKRRHLSTSILGAKTQNSNIIVSNQVYFNSQHFKERGLDIYPKCPSFLPSVAFPHTYNCAVFRVLATSNIKIKKWNGSSNKLFYFKPKYHLCHCYYFLVYLIYWLNDSLTDWTPSLIYWLLLTYNFSAIY